MNTCGNCTECCNGNLFGETHGVEFGNGIPCQYCNAKKGECSIYDDRPQFCRDYQCLYTQNIIPELKRPNKNKLLVSVNDDEQGNQYLRVNISHKDYDEDQLKLLQKFAKEQNTKLEAYTNTYDSSCIKHITHYLKAKGERKIIKTLLDSFLKHATELDQIISISEFYFENKFYEETIEILEKYFLNKEYSFFDTYTINYNYILCCVMSNQPEKAIKVIDKYIPKSSGEELHKYMLDKGLCLTALGKRNEAKNIYFDILKLNPNQTIKEKVEFNLSIYKFKKNDFKGAIKSFIKYVNNINSHTWEKEFLSEIPLDKRDNFKKWNGEVIPNAKIIVVSDAGIGDDIINIRFFEKIKNLGMKPYFSYYGEGIRKTLLPFFEKNNIELIHNPKEIGTAFYCQGMSLPDKLDLDLNDLWDGPYLKPDIKYVEKWNKKLKSNKLKVGIKWSGQPDYDHDLHRTIHLKDIYNAVKDLDADFYSLQIDNFEEEINDFPGIIDLHEDITSWDDTFSIIENLDFVITSCTSIAHASGSIGKKTFVFVPLNHYYTWAQIGKKSYWYGDNMNLLYQNKPRVWTEQCEELKDTLLLEYK